MVKQARDLVEQLERSRKDQEAAWLRRQTRLNRLKYFFWKLFYETLCPTPDQTTLGSLWLTGKLYALTGRIAWWFYPGRR